MGTTLGMDPARQLVIVADDFGIGPATSRGILDLAERGHITATVLLVNSPHAEESVLQWHRVGGPALVELGWHPCLTLDRPLLPPCRVPSLVRADGSFLSLGQLLCRLLTGRVAEPQVRAELRAQYDRFRQMTGRPPRVVNGHHHIHVLPGITRSLIDVLSQQHSSPYVRRVVETVAMLRAEDRARGKRLFLATLGRRSTPALSNAGFPGNDVLVGITDPHGLAWPNEEKAGERLCRWLRAAPGTVVELMCHPGRHDKAARRCDEPSPLSGLVVQCGPEVRVRELELLATSSLTDQLEQCGFRRLGPRDLFAGLRAERQAA